MAITKTEWHTKTRKGATAAVAVLLMSLAACGGSNTSSTATSTNGEAATTGGTGDTTSSTTSTSSTNSGLFDGIFLKESGAGYYQFDASFQAGKAIGSGRTAFYVSSDTDSNFSTTSSPVGGTFTQQYSTQAYITNEGAFTSQSTPYTDIGTNSKIFSKLPQGYEYGMQGMSTPLYHVTINAQDVSGQPVSKVVNQDQGPATNGLSSLLQNDNSPMPQGAQIYQQPYTVVTTHLWTNLSSGASNWTSLESVQASVGGTIQSLGGYRYLQPSPNSVAYIEYNGAIHIGELLNAGDVHDVDPAAYNRVAADFIAQREAAALGH